MNRLLCYVLLLLLFVSACSRSGRRRSRASNEENNRVVPEQIVEPVHDPITPNAQIEPANFVIDQSHMEDLYSTIQGDLVQTEGKVVDHVMELIIDLKQKRALPNDASSVEQILAIRNHISNNWSYVNDPIRNIDTWRPASITIDMIHKGMYSGDCDDYAILLASFARQVGLESRFVAGFSRNDRELGHAWAEFMVPRGQGNSSLLKNEDTNTGNGSTWVSLDWFRGSDHNVFMYDTTIFDNL
jgi:hypothetical protein